MRQWQHNQRTSDVKNSALASPTCTTACPTFTASDRKTCTVQWEASAASFIVLAAAHRQSRTRDACPWSHAGSEAGSGWRTAPGTRAGNRVCPAYWSSTIGCFAIFRLRPVRGGMLRRLRRHGMGEGWSTSIRHVTLRRCRFRQTAAAERIVCCRWEIPRRSRYKNMLTTRSNYQLESCSSWHDRGCTGWMLHDASLRSRELNSKPQYRLIKAYRKCRLTFLLADYYHSDIFTHRTARCRFQMSPEWRDPHRNNFLSGATKPVFIFVWISDWQEALPRAVKPRTRVGYNQYVRRLRSYV